MGAPRVGAYGQAQPWALLTDTPVAQTEPTLYACRHWNEQGFRGLKTVGDPCMVGEGSSPWLAVAYGTRREEAEARHLPPGRLRRPPAELSPAQQHALPPRRHSLLQQGVALLRRLLLRGGLGACVWLRPTPGPDFRTRLRRVHPGGT